MRIKLFISTVILLSILSACSSGSAKDVGVEQTNFKTVEELFNGNEGYLLIYLDNDNKYIDQLEELATKEKKNVLLYDPYKEDGENENDRPVYPEEDVEGNMLYFIKDGEIQKEVDVNRHKGAALEQELKVVFE